MSGIYAPAEKEKAVAAIPSYWKFAQRRNAREESSVQVRGNAPALNPA